MTKCPPSCCFSTVKENKATVQSITTCVFSFIIQKLSISNHRSPFIQIDHISFVTISKLLSRTCLKSFDQTLLLIGEDIVSLKPKQLVTCLFVQPDFYASARLLPNSNLWLFHAMFCDQIDEKSITYIRWRPNGYLTRTLSSLLINKSILIYSALRKSAKQISHRASQRPSVESSIR